MSPRVGHADRVWGAGLGSNGLLDACVSPCVLDCGVGAFDNTQEWQCVNALGAQVAVTQGTSPTYEPSPLGGATALGNITDAKAPYVAAATAATALGSGFWAGDHTVMAIFASGTTTDPAPLSHGNDSVSGFYMQVSASGGGRLYCNYSAAASAQYPYATASVIQKWIMPVCRRSGSNYIVSIDGVQSSTAITVTAAAPTTENLYFGRYSGAGLPLNGDLLRVRFYSIAVSDSALIDTENKLYGERAETRAVGVDRNSTAWLTADNGYIYSIGDDEARINASGILSERAKTNYWLQSLDASAWTDVGTPIITANTDSGPFVYFAGGAEADTIEDNDALAIEGKSSASAGTTTGTYTVSCYLASGTASTAELAVLTDGGGGGACLVSGLTAAFARKTCTPTPITGVPTYIKGSLGVGSVVGTTGTIKVAGCQLEIASHATSQIINTTTALQRVAEKITASSVGIPIRGAIEFDMTPIWSNAVDVDGFSFVAIDTRTAGNGVLVYVDGTTLTATVGNGTNTTTLTAALSWEAGVTYRIKLEYQSAMFRLFRDGVVVDTETTGLYPPSAHASTIGIGSTVSGLATCNCSIKRLGVFRD